MSGIVSSQVGHCGWIASWTQLPAPPTRLRFWFPLLKIQSCTCHRGGVGWNVTESSGSGSGTGMGMP